MSLPFSLVAYLFATLAVAEPIDKALLWGPYRPNLYFGIRPRIPTGPIFGLMWGTTENGKLNPQTLRHACEQSDGMAGYGWTTYDARNGGVQTISDPGNTVNLTVEFAKFPDRIGDWSVRVRGVPLGDVKSWNISMIFYLGVENASGNESSAIQCSSTSAGAVSCLGDTPGLGQYSSLMPPPISKGKIRTVVKSMKVANDRLWEAKSFLLDETISPDISPRNQSNYGNLHYIQRSFETTFWFNVHFVSNHVAALVPTETFATESQDAALKFIDQFYSVYQPSPSYSAFGYPEFSRSLLSNLMGGTGYFYGDDRVNRSSVSPNVKKPHELFTMVPSRSFFPRGFLWDEGFHLLVVINWDLELALEILQSWFALMDENGWIAREQILGAEARSKVPKEFQTQNLDYANPPTLFLVVEAFLDIVSGKKTYHGTKSVHLEAKAARDFLVQLYPNLKKHYEWWRKTQREDSSYVSHGGHVYHGYRWKGQTAAHILTSGLDDYPHTNPPGSHDLHVDALSWVSLMAGVLGKVAYFLGDTNEFAVFREHKEGFDRSIEFLHWSKDDQAYCDTTKNNGVSVHECHKGYTSLFPFLLNSWNASHPHMNATLSLMRNEKELWSPFGLRSLSRSDKLYGTEENYWRGPIWININYLALTKLLELAKTTGAYQETARTMYVDLRKNIISTVYNSWQSTGFAWEQYNAETGAGQRTQGFTGWTALLVNILAMPDFAKAATSEKLELPSDFRPAMDDIFSMAALLFFVVLVFGIAFALKACYMSRYAGYTGIVQRPSPHLYLRMRHITSYI